VHRAWEVAEETTHVLSDAVADVEQQWEESEIGCREQLKELTIGAHRASISYANMSSKCME
jgi:hypothetical protein